MWSKKIKRGTPVVALKDIWGADYTVPSGANGVVKDRWKAIGVWWLAVVFDDKTVAVLEKEVDTKITGAKRGSKY